MSRTKNKKNSALTATQGTKESDLSTVKDPNTIIECESAENNLSFLLKHIGTGRKKAISMHELCQKTHMDDRALRKSIVSARLEGAMIIGDVHGYYIFETIEELIKWFQTSYKRAMTTLKYLKHARKIILDHGYRIDKYGNVSKAKDKDK